MKYGLTLLSFILAYSYIAYSFIKGGFGTFELSIFSIFIILTMASLIAISENSNKGWFLSSILMAFLISYFVMIFLNGETIVRFLLMALSVLSFIASITGITFIDETDMLKQELEELND